MTLEHNITVIVMLCRIREMRNHREKEKCHQYWPVDCQEHKIIRKIILKNIFKLILLKPEREN